MKTLNDTRHKTQRISTKNREQQTENTIENNAGIQFLLFALKLCTALLGDFHNFIYLFSSL